MKMFQRQAATNSIGMLFGGRLILKRCTSVGAVMPNHALAHIIAMIKFDFSLPSAWAEFLGKIWRDGHSLLPATVNVLHVGLGRLTPTTARFLVSPKHAVRSACV